MIKLSVHSMFFSRKIGQREPSLYPKSFHMTLKLHYTEAQSWKRLAKLLKTWVFMNRW